MFSLPPPPPPPFSHLFEFLFSPQVLFGEDSLSLAALKHYVVDGGGVGVGEEEAQGSFSSCAAGGLFFFGRDEEGYFAPNSLECLRQSAKGSRMRTVKGGEGGGERRSLGNGHRKAGSRRGLC